jgi:hypothetical protein
MMTAFWNIVSRSLVDVNGSFRGRYCIQHKGNEIFIAQMMESETSVYFWETTRRNIPESGHLQVAFFLLVRNTTEELDAFILTLIACLVNIYLSNIHYHNIR